MEIKLGFIIAMVIISSYYGSKLIDWIRNEREKRFATNTAHFVSDIFRLQQKWIKKGELGFIKPLSAIIEFYSQDPEEEIKQAQTPEGRAMQERIKKLAAQEIANQVDDVFNP